jgi:hypothetical protein
LCVDVLIVVLVTAVGATDGPQKGSAEIACQSTENGLITTGGGFSTYYPAPSWQTDAIELFFNRSDASGFTPAAGYNPAGRGYPDVSLVGADYPVVINGDIYRIFGTSASTPVFAAFVSLLNALRLGRNASSGGVGWLNPTLYAVGNNVTFNGTDTLIFNDVTSGDNKCCAHNNPALATCCASGFTAVSGWDPVTGWGSVDFPKFAALFGFVVAGIASADDNDDGGSGSGSGGGGGDGETTTIIIVVVACLLAVVVGLVVCCREGTSGKVGVVNVSAVPGDSSPDNS